MPDTISHINATTDTVPLAGVLLENTAAADTVAAPPAGETRSGVVIDRAAEGRDGLPRPASASDSWLTGLLLLLFALLGLRYRQNYKFLRIITLDLTDVGRRHSLFDETVRETSYMLLLNLLWGASAGALLYSGLLGSGRAGSLSPVAGMGVCAAAVLTYGVMEWCLYWVCGRVFSTSRLTWIWLRGMRACQALTSLGLFPLALGAMISPGGAYWLPIAGAVLYGGIRIVYIVQGFRIFFNRAGGIVPFFYYLCALETAPLLLICRIASRVCEALA